MNIVQVTAPSEVLGTLHGIDGFEMVGGGLRRAHPDADDDVWITAAYATDDAIAQARAAGAQVVILTDSASRLARLNEVAERARARLREIEEEGAGD